MASESAREILPPSLLEVKIRAPSCGGCSAIDDNGSTTNTNVSDLTTTTFGSASLSTNSGLLRGNLQQTSQRHSKRIRAKNKIKFEAFAANRFQFDKLGFFGREDEKQALFAALSRSCSKSSGSRELILIEGESGSGKTALALEFEKAVKQKKRGAFVFGKFNVEAQTDQGCSAISEICAQVCNIVISRKTCTEDGRVQYMKIKQQFIEKFRGVTNEISVLRELVPGLVGIIADDGENDTSMDLPTLPRNRNHLGNEQDQAKLLWGFRTFFRIVCEALHPLVVTLDDMQWSDTASLRLIEALVNDLDNSKLFLVFLYRSNLDNQHIFAKTICDFKERKQNLGPLRLSHLILGNLPIPVINEFLMKNLNYDGVEETLQLAQIFYRRTLGLAFAVVALLRRLDDEKLLRYDVDTHQYTWDIQNLEKTAAMTNVVELMKEDLTRLPKLLQRRLSIAACLGNSFEPDALNFILERMEKDINPPTYEDSMEQGSTVAALPDNWFSVPEDFGFIERRYGSDNRITYRWIHDQVRFAAISLLPADELRVLKGKIGKFLLISKLPSRLEDSDDTIFVVARLLHEALSMLDQSERLQLARINLEAARKARGVSAIKTAATFAGRGIELLPVDRWAPENKALTLELLTIAAETGEAAGSVELVNSGFQEVISRNDVPISVLLDIGNSQARSICTREPRADEAIDIVLLLLKTLGVEFAKTEPGRIMSMIKQLVKIKKRCKFLTSSFLLQQPDMEPMDIAVMKLLFSLSTYSYLSESKSLMALAIFKMATYTFERGISMFTPPTLALLGTVFTGFLNDYKLGGKMGILAMLLLEKRRYTSTDCWTRYVVFQFTRI